MHLWDDWCRESPFDQAAHRDVAYSAPASRRRDLWFRGKRLGLLLLDVMRLARLLDWLRRPRNEIHRNPLIDKARWWSDGWRTRARRALPTAHVRIAAVKCFLVLHKRQLCAASQHTTLINAQTTIRLHSPDTQVYYIKRMKTYQFR